MVPSRFLHAQLPCIRHSSLVNVMLVPALSRIWPKKITPHSSQRVSPRVLMPRTWHDTHVHRASGVEDEARPALSAAPPRAPSLAPRTQLDAHTQQTYCK